MVMLVSGCTGVGSMGATGSTIGGAGSGITSAATAGASSLTSGTGVTSDMASSLIMGACSTGGRGVTVTGGACSTGSWLSCLPFEPNHPIIVWSMLISILKGCMLGFSLARQLLSTSRLSRVYRKRL